MQIPGPVAQVSAFVRPKSTLRGSISRGPGWEWDEMGGQPEAGGAPAHQCPHQLLCPLSIYPALPRHCQALGLLGALEPAE